MKLLFQDFYDVSQHYIVNNANKSEVIYVHNYEPQCRNFILNNKHLFPFIYEFFNEFMCTEFTCEGVIYKLIPNDKQFVFKGTNNSYPNSFQWELEFKDRVITFETFLQLNKDKTISVEVEDCEDILLIN